MRLTLPDPSHPTQSRTYDYPDAPVETLLTWLLAIPLWQRAPNAVSQRLEDFRLALGTARATGTATEVVRGDPPIEHRATEVGAAVAVAVGPAPLVVVTTATPAVNLSVGAPETPGQARARRMREGKAAKAAARLTGSVS